MISLICFSTRLEETNIARRDGLAKVVGTIASVGGATIITLYKGPPLLHLQMDHIQGDNTLLQADESSTKMQNWTWGCIYLLGHCLSWAGWIVFQVFSMIMVYEVYLNLKLQIRYRTNTDTDTRHNTDTLKKISN